MLKLTAVNKERSLTKLLVLTNESNLREFSKCSFFSKKYSQSNIQFTSSKYSYIYVMLFCLLIYFYRRHIDLVSLKVLQISYIARWQFMTWLVQCWLIIWQRMLPNIEQYFSAKKSQGLSSSFQYSEKNIYGFDRKWP